MAYFANGTEGGMWEDRNCGVCVFFQKPCPIIAAQMFGNYDQCSNDDLRVVLDTLIPQEEGKAAQDCPMRLMIEAEFKERKPPKGLIPLPGFKIDNQTENGG